MAPDFLSYHLPQHVLPLPCRDLKLENILDSKDNMKVSISSFSRRVALQDASGESPRDTPTHKAAHQGSTEPDLLQVWGMVRSCGALGHLGSVKGELRP